MVQVQPVLDDKVDTGRDTQTDQMIKAQLGKMILRIKIVMSQVSTCLEHNDQHWGCQTAQYTALDSE